VTVGSGANGLPAVVPDPQGAAPGRGAHLHPTTACYELAVRRKAFGRGLRVSGQPDSAAVGSYIAGLTPEQTEDRPEGWSSSS
jgi:uncharacterized protein